MKICRKRNYLYPSDRSRRGNITLSSQEYVDIIKEINAIYNPDYIDFEYFTHKSVFQEMLDFPNLILSYHNFEETPENLMEAFQK